MNQQVIFLIDRWRRRSYPPIVSESAGRTRLGLVSHYHVFNRAGAVDQDERMNQLRAQLIQEVAQMSEVGEWS